MGVVAIPCEIYEAVFDETISSAYCFEISEVKPDKIRPEYWLIVEDPIRSHISSIDAKYYPNLFEAALNVRLQTSKFSATISSTTVNYES